jgi:hypothetical protein
LLDYLTPHIKIGVSTGEPTSRHDYQVNVQNASRRR